MNKFRVNLHPAFFDGVEAQNAVEPAKETLDKFSKEELNKLKDEIKAEVSGKKASRIDNRLKEQHDKDQEQTNDDIWTNNITEGYGRLVTALRENHYFEDKDEAQELSKIKKQYQEEVKRQYEKIVGKRSNKRFEKVDENLFDKSSPNSPANKIYTELTGAATISKVDRQYTEGYNVDFLGNQNLGQEQKTETKQNTVETPEKEIDKKNRKFLSNDLPEYLWNIRKTPGVLNVIKWLPIFSVKVDRPSEVDRDAISDFLKAANRIPTKDGKSPAMVLLEALHDNRLNTDSTRDTYATVLASHGMDLNGFKKEGTNDVDYKQFGKCISKIMEVGNFYINTQEANNDVKDQHAIYLSVLGIIEDSKGAENAVNKFKKIVEDAKTEKKTEKKEGYESGEKLTPEFKAFAEKLGISDFTNATRLSKLDEKYFKDTPVEKILANLNNDSMIDARDTMAGGLKTGAQFLNIFKQVGAEIGDKRVSDGAGKESIIKGSDVALNNLLNRGKLDNKVLGLGLDESKFTKAEIQGGNKELVLLLQNIINKPGEDLYTLLSGHEGDPFKGLDLQKENEAAKKYVAENFKNMDPQALRGIGLQTPENIQTGLAGALFEAYKRGVGVGGQISFDQWVKGLAMNTGFQVRDDGNVVVGIGLDYKKKINLGKKGWSTTPDASAGVFIPLGYGKPDVTGTVGLNDEVAKEWVTKKGVQEKLGMQVGATLLIPTATPIISAGLSWERDKAAGIEYREQELRGEMQDKMKKILTEIEQKMGDKKTLDFTKIDISLVENIIGSEAKTSGVEEKDIKKVVNATKRLLINYNGANLANENVRDIIATKVADQYAMAWAEDRKAHISDKAYLSGANLGAFWVAGSPLVGIYAGVKFTKHDLDGYGDRWGQEQEIAQEYQGEWNQEMLKGLNQQLGLLGDKEIKLENGFVVIPASLKHRVNVNEKMYRLMMKDGNGNILLHTQTPMAADIRKGAATQGTELIVGGKKGGQYVKLDTIGPDWLVNDKINQDRVLELGEGISTYTNGILDMALANLKTKFPKGDPIQALQLTQEQVTELVEKLNKLDKSKKAKIVIAPNKEGKLEPQNPVEGDAGKGLEIEYQARFEMIDPKAKEIANAVYAEALKVKDPKALNAVKHKPWPEYEAFNKAMTKDVETKKEPDYVEARKAIKPIFEKLDQQIKGAKFAEIGNKLDGITDINALGQALMSINNIFARSKKVRGGGENYEFKGRNKSGKEVPVSMGSIIAEREGQISKTINDYTGENITSKVKAGYQSLIDASAEYRKKSKVFDKKTSAQAESLKNTVGFNLGDKTNPENPLFNPEIYNPMVDLKKLENYGFGAEQRNALQERAMRLFAGNEALINPILKYLGLEGKKVEIKDFSEDEGKGKLTLDIGEGNDIKKVTLNAGMKFGYFTQCVNHTVILDDISAETEDGTNVKFNSGVWENSNYVEGNENSILTSTTFGLGVAAIVHNGGKPGNQAGTNQEGIIEPPQGETGLEGQIEGGVIPEGGTGLGGSHSQGGGMVDE